MPCLAITGANGFVGRFLTSAALTRGWSVRAMSRDTQWLRTLQPQTLLAVHEWDLLAHSDGAADRALEGADVVCHLAAYLPADYRDSTQAQACLMANGIGTQNLLDASRRAGVGQFIYYSSGNGYAGDKPLVSETDAVFPARHATYYLTSKLAGELYCEHERLARGGRIATLRLSSVYGPGQTKGVLPAFIKKLSAGEPVPLQDGGRHTADFVFVEDVVQATMKAIERQSAGIYNVGGGKGCSVLELARTIAGITGASFDLLQMQPPTGAAVSGFSGLDIAKAQRDLGYVPTPMLEGIQRCVQFFNNA